MEEKLGDTALAWQDALVIAAYFIIVMGVGIWSSIRSKRDSVSGYFLAGRSMHWIPVGASLFASNIGSGHFIGLAGSGASTGIGVAGFELNAIYVLMILGWIFVPVYMSSRVYTMPEYLKKRFGGQRIQIYLSVLALLLYVFTKISADLYAGAIFINQSIKLDLYGSVVSLLAFAAVFTVAGGLSAVIWTDFVQTILMILGALYLMILSFIKVGGYENLVKQFATKEPNPAYIGYNLMNESCSKVPNNYMHLLRSADDSDMPWTGMIFGLTISAVWYWCSDQVIVQRALSAKDLVHAKAGCLLAGYLKLLPLFLLIFPGMAARVLYTDEIGCSNPVECRKICGSENGCSNIAYPQLVIHLMPPGARGLMLAVMLAALMSSLTSIFNSSSTIFTLDIWTRIRKQASEMEMLIVGRVFILVLVVISIVWIPIIEASQGSQLFHYIQSVTSYLAPPVCAVYVLALFSTRINEKGAFWGLMIGLVVGIIRFALDFSFTAPPCASGKIDDRPAIVAKVHYLHFACILFIITCLVCAAVSLLTEPMDKSELDGLTFWTQDRIEEKPKENENPDDAHELGEMNMAYTKEEEVSNSGNPTNGIVIPVYNAHEITPDYKERPMWKKALFFLCGISSELEKSKAEPSQHESITVAEVALFIRQRPAWRRLCNGNAIILLVLASFVWGYFA